MYNSVEELLERAKTENKRLHEVIAQNEMSISDISEEMLYDRLEKHYQTMVASAAKAVNAPQDMPGVDFIKGQSLKQAQYSESQTLGGSYLNNIMTMALSCCEVNAGMGRICAAPTAGACGILPAVLIETSRKLNSTKKEILDALLVAAGFGAIFVRNSTVSGAEGGCQAEVGAASAMAAAALCHLKGGAPEQCAAAAASFKGAGRRFEVYGECNGAVVVDDYAHHPTELRATLNTAKELGYKRLIAVHQPFTYSRTKMLFNDFVDVLKIPDVAVITPIMGSREPNDPTITSAKLAAQIPGSVLVDSLEAAADWVKQNAREGDLVITLGCGDIYKASKMMVADNNK